MNFSNKIIVEKIKSFKLFDLNSYNILVNNFGIDRVKEVFNELYNAADEGEKEKLLNLYYPYFISADLENMDLSNDNYFLLIDKYGYENIENYFTELLLQTKNPSYLKKKYEFFYNIIDDNSLSIDDKSEDFDVQYNDAFKLYLKDIGQYPLRAPAPERFAGRRMDEADASDRQSGARPLEIRGGVRAKLPARRSPAVGRIPFRSQS